MAWRVPLPTLSCSTQGWGPPPSRRAGCLHRPGHPLSRCSPSPRPPRLLAPSHRPAAFPALPPPRLVPGSWWVAWPPARSPAPSMGCAVTGDRAAPAHRAKLPPVQGVCPLPVPPWAACGAPGLCRQGGCHKCGVQMGMGKGSCSVRVLKTPGTDAVGSRPRDGTTAVPTGASPMAPLLRPPWVPRWGPGTGKEGPGNAKLGCGVVGPPPWAWGTGMCRCHTE